MNCPNHPDAPAELTCVGCAKMFCKDCIVELGGQQLCATCKEDKLRDMKSGTVGLDLASPWARFGAMFIDGIVFLPITIGLLYYYWGTTSILDHYVVRTLMPAVVWIVYEWQMLEHGGQTLGKKAVGIKVVAANGGDLQSQPLIRAISRQAMGLTYILGIIDSLMVFTGGNRTLHDRIAGTAVINWKR
jgi:uncharacterized RDD family membrane protein YckC